MGIISAIINFLIRFFLGDKIEKLSIPHPEDVKNVGVKVDDINIQFLLSDWFVQWNVMNRMYFRDVWIRLIENLSVNFYGKVPAATYSQEMRIELDPEWANPGVLAHEMAHISYFNLLSENHQAEFEVEYKKALEDNDLLKYVASKKPYMRTGGIQEAYADCYRYLGNQMPENLKPYYPNLMLARLNRHQTQI